MGAGEPRALSQAQFQFREARPGAGLQLVCVGPAAQAARPPTQDGVGGKGAGCQALSETSFTRVPGCGWAQGHGSFTETRSFFLWKPEAPHSPAPTSTLPSLWAPHRKAESHAGRLDKGRLRDSECQVHVAGLPSNCVGIEVTCSTKEPAEPVKDAMGPADTRVMVLHLWALQEG